MRIVKSMLRVLCGLALALPAIGAHANGGAQLRIAPAAPTMAASSAVHVRAARGAVPIVADPTPAPPSATGESVETVTERYRNGNVKIERQVTKDAAGNYINHGTYTLYGPDGKVLKTGEFLFGKQQGKWIQTFAKDKGHLFSADHDGEFLGLFVSEATFADGQLQGAWTIKDHNGQNIVAWNFDQGIRNGTWTWWHGNGQKRLEATFKNGHLDGDVSAYNRDGQRTAKTTYVDGRRLATSTGWYTLSQKRFEGCYLRAANMSDPTYDWWNDTVTTTDAKPAGPDLKHGAWTEWYPSGNKKTEGRYDHGVAVGRFTWWYENGQKQAEVDYQNGALGGTWITWHPNGLKESQAEYREGELIEKWMHWNADGKLVEVRDGSQLPAKQPVGNNSRTTRQMSVPTIRSR